jgi:hypothetical protein
MSGIVLYALFIAKRMSFAGMMSQAIPFITIIFALKTLSKP